MREQPGQVYNLTMTLDTALSPHLKLLEEVASAGFAIALHVRYTTPTHLFQTYPAAWTQEYARDGLVMQDPAVAWAFEQQGHIAWCDLTSRDEAGVLRRAAAHGLRHGLSVSLLRDGSRSLGGFARADRPFTAAEVAAIEAALEALHDGTRPARDDRHGGQQP